MSLPASDGAWLAEIARRLGLPDFRVEPLPGGPANEAFLLRGATGAVVVRRRHAAAATLGADPDSEHAMHRLAAGAGLAPEVLLAAPAQGLLVTRHVSGQMPAPRDFGDARFLARLGRWLATLHALPVPGGLPVVDFGERAAGYLARVAPLDAEAAAIARALDARRAALPPPARLVPCHHDLHRRNLVDAGARLLAVDWEYAGPGDPAADLAACIGYNALDAQAVDALVVAYGAGGSGMRARVAALGWIFDCLWYAWNAAAARAGLAVDGALQRRLAGRLAAGSVAR